MEEMTSRELVSQSTSFAELQRVVSALHGLLGGDGLEGYSEVEHQLSLWTVDMSRSTNSNLRALSPERRQTWKDSYAPH